MMLNRRELLGGMSLPIGASLLPGLIWPQTSRAMGAVNELAATPGAPK